MAATKYIFILAIAATLVPSSLATDFVVGDDKGWTINFDYQAWAQGKDFHVGDKLVFKYSEGAHNVLRVNGTGFQECAAPEGTEALSSGNDEIILATPGRKWYICGVSRHCVDGKQKLAITVELPQTPVSPESAPSPTSAARGRFAPTFWWMVAVSGILMMAMV
ncbi:blue copper protein 1a-like [Juglans microcarpa x Juglans regia]|uniref:blue copper protein 1a-like n=1 Tax=Juglans microcarpa x Juglans regia TaxID=2249226 RepID=UPI001B7F4E51|nr:blue copper protein 1a-like [Juglans microcarpa x Juglans regia]